MVGSREDPRGGRDMHETVSAIDQQVDDELRRLQRVDLSALADATINPTTYAITPLLPRGHVTLLSSHGGTGKTLLALILAAHVACGRTWAELAADRGRVLFVSLEDSGELLRFRLRRICTAYDLPFDEVAHNLMVLDGSAGDTVLAIETVYEGIRQLVYTSLLDEIEDAAAGVNLVIVDNISDAYGGNENDRRLVRSFMRRLARLAQRFECAVALLAHIDKSGARYGTSGESYAGSTAWNNSARSRLALVENDGDLELRQEKLNVAKSSAPIKLGWNEAGVLLPVTKNGTEAKQRDTTDDDAVLAAIDAAIKSGATVHAARSGSHSALAILKTYPELPKELRRDATRFWGAVTRLERASALLRETYRNENRKERTRLVCAAPLPPHPPIAAQGRTLGRRATAPVARDMHRRTTGALARSPCPKCNGEGCSWCE